MNHSKIFEFLGIIFMFQDIFHSVQQKFHS